MCIAAARGKVVPPLLACEASSVVYFISSILTNDMIAINASYLGTVSKNDENLCSI